LSQGLDESLIPSLPVLRKTPPEAKKTDVAEHLWVFDHVGLLVNGSPGTAGLPFI
jgi:hypothetical protein